MAAYIANPETNPTITVIKRYGDNNNPLIENGSSDCGSLTDCIAPVIEPTIFGKNVDNAYNPPIKNITVNDNIIGNEFKCRGLLIPPYNSP